eukprot:gene21187-36644_t
MVHTVACPTLTGALFGVVATAAAVLRRRLNSVTALIYHDSVGLKALASITILTFGKLRLRWFFWGDEKWVPIENIPEHCHWIELHHLAFDAYRSRLHGRLEHNYTAWKERGGSGGKIGFAWHFLVGACAEAGCCRGFNPGAVLTATRRPIHDDSSDAAGP